MSGPIVRKYGFPNFENIFGKRELQHGVDEPPPTPAGGTDKASKPEQGPEPGPGPARPTGPA